jgi:hypothetical protein
VIAHSFGTFAIFKALKEREIKLHRVLLCGCIVPCTFRRAEFGGQLGCDPLMNDCGTRDVWPVLAQSLTWGFGSTGTYGFGTSGVVDRFNEFEHGDYFSKAFVEKYWVPFLQDGIIVRSEFESNRATPNYLLSLLGVIHLKYVILTALGVIGWLMLR